MEESLFQGFAAFVLTQLRSKIVFQSPPWDLRKGKTCHDWCFCLILAIMTKQQRVTLAGQHFQKINVFRCSSHSKGSDLLKVSWSSCCVFKLIVKSKQCQACGLEVVRVRPLLVAKDPIFHSPSLTGGNKSNYLWGKFSSSLDNLMF